MIHANNGNVTLKENNSVPTHAVLLFSNGDSEHDIKVEHLSLHTVKQGQLAEGVLIDKDRLSDLLTSGSDDPKKGWIEPHILMNNANFMIWYRPNSTRTLDMVDKGNERTFNVNFPATLFIYKKTSKTLMLFALPNNERPNLNTMLYHLPVGNVSQTGCLCMGTGAGFLPYDISPNTAHLIEETFFGARSGHTNQTSLFAEDVKNQKQTSFAKIIAYWQKKAISKKSIKVEKEFVEYLSIKSVLETINLRG